MYFKLRSFLKNYNDIELMRIFLFGLCSGFCLLLSGNTLNFWLASLEINTVTLGLFSLVTVPYISKYLWSPIIDKCDILFLSKKIGRKKSWILLSQTCIAIFTLILSFFDPINNITIFSIFAFLIAFFSVTQDMVLDAKRIELIQNSTKDISGPASAIYIFGYRMGMLISGAGAIFISYFLSWNDVYKIMAGFILCLSVILQLSINKEIYEAKSKNTLSFKDKIKAYFLDSFKSLGNNKYVLYLIMFIFLYQSGDHMIGSMRNLFVIQLGFNEIEIAKAAKLFGVAASLLGGFLSGSIMNKTNIKKCLIWFGLIHILSHFSFIAQYSLGYNLTFLYILVAVEGVTGGMVTACLIAYISGLCNKEFYSTQYAFLSSIIGFSRMFFSSISGFVLNLTNWPIFFIIVMLITLPSLILLSLQNKTVKN